MFVEKYRPKKFSEIVGQDKIVKAIQGYIKKDGIIPNLLFVGDPGIGKTTLAHVLARALFGKDYTNSFLELNASSDRGIDVVRNRISEFARTKSFHKFKIVFLDEASEITKDAQHALRRIMEVNYKNCRFILSCNYIEKVIEPIKSRCRQFKFKKIKSGELIALARKVAKAEEAEIGKSKIRLMAIEAQGDARKLLNLLESVIAGSDIDALEGDLDDLFSLSISEFISIAYSVDSDRILNALVRQGLKLKKGKVITLLADCDFKFRLGTIKQLQLIASFIKIKGVL